MDGVPGIGPRADPDRREHRLRVRRAPVRAPSVPLPRGPAGGAHRQGPLRRVHHRSEEAARRGRRARDGDERLRHELRPGERDLRGQHRRRSTISTDPVVVKRGELVRIYLRQHPRVRPDQLVPHPRQLLPLLPDRDVADAVGVHGHDRPGAGAARDPRARVPVSRQVHVPRPQDRVRGARLDGLLRGEGLMAAEGQAFEGPPVRGARLWLYGLVPLALLALVLGLFFALGGTGIGKPTGARRRRSSRSSARSCGRARSSSRSGTTDWTTSPSRRRSSMTGSSPSAGGH